MNASVSPDDFASALDSLKSHRILLIGGKGGVGKTTVSILAALQIANERRTILFSSDPASNLSDILTSPVDNLVVERFAAEELYAEFLGRNLESLLELTDRGTYLEKEEARKFFELSLPGIDELMAWLRLGQLSRRDGEALLVVDTAPTGHTLRMLASSNHFEEFTRALESMQRKHKDLVQQFMRREVRDAVDDFLGRFESETAEIREMLGNRETAAFVPVALSQELVLEQTIRLRDAVRSEGIDVPFVILNRVVADGCNCGECQEARSRDDAARSRLAPDHVVELPRACFPLDSIARLEMYAGGVLHEEPKEETAPVDPKPLALPAGIKMLFFGGKGGVGKTTIASSVAIQIAEQNPSERFVLLSVDPAHALADLFAHIAPPSNLTIETIDTRRRWKKLRETIGGEIERVFDALTPKGLRIAHDADVMRQLLDVAPPGADEIFAIMRLQSAAADESIRTVFVDTAPTGHFLRLIDLPKSASEWVREFMRLLLRYRDVVPPGALGEELVDASRALTAFQVLLTSPQCGAVVVCRPESVVVAETVRLREELRSRGINETGLVANYATPVNNCECDIEQHSHESSLLASLAPLTMVIRQSSPPSSLDDLRALVPLRHTSGR